MTARSGAAGGAARRSPGRTSRARISHYDAFAVRWRTPRRREGWATTATFAFDVAGIPAALTVVLGRDAIAVPRVGEVP